MKSKANRLKALYNLHAWVGFQLALLMFVVLSTGTLATFSNEIDWLIFDEMRASSSEQTESLVLETEDWVKIYQSIQNRYPDASITSMRKASDDYLTFRVVLDHPDLVNRFVQVDPYTFKVKGDIPRLTVQRFFRDFHRYLFMPAVPGLLIVGPLSLALLFSIYSGLKTTRNWRKVLFRLRINSKPRVFLSDLHKTMGLWGIWFSILMGVTGLWYLYEFGYAISGHPIEPKATKIETSIEHPHYAYSMKEFKQIVSLAQNAHEDWEITELFMPRKPKDTIQLRGVPLNNPVIRSRSLRVFIDPQSLNIVDVWTPSSIGFQAYINEYIDPLHFGSFAGFWLKFVWFIFGVALSGLSLTGVIMTWKRTNTSALSSFQKKSLFIYLGSILAFIFWLNKLS